MARSSIPAKGMPKKGKPSPAAYKHKTATAKKAKASGPAGSKVSKKSGRGR